MLGIAGVVRCLLLAGQGSVARLLSRSREVWIGFPQTSTCINRPSLDQLRPHIPEQGLLQVVQVASLVHTPWPVRALKPRFIRKPMEGRESRTSSGCDPALSRIWFGSPITVASGGCELVAPWTPERVA